MCHNARDVGIIKVLEEVETLIPIPEGKMKSE
jgi:hypothetical protein